MYSIGEFSRINKVTPKTLRYYDRIGLLAPAETDPWTGYRYYTPEQLPEARRILMLKQLGFSLSEIQEILNETVDLETLLKKREREVQRSIRDEQRRLGRVREALAKMREGETMQDRIRITTLPEVVVASMRTTVPDYDAFFEIVPKMGEYMESVGAVCREPAYCFTIFHNDEYREEDIDVEICEAVTEPKEASETVTFKQIPEVPAAACITHTGPYSRLGESYNALFTWIEESGYAVADHPRESYIDGIWNKEDPEEWRTEVQVPVARKGDR